MNINKVILMGRLTADPELKTTQGGILVVQFSVAVNRKYSKEEQKTDFIECTAFRQSAEFLSKYFRKGSSVIVFGNIQVENWKDKDGNNRKSVRVIVDELQFGEAKNRDSGSENATLYGTADNSGLFSDIMEEDGTEAQLPF